MYESPGMDSAEDKTVEKCASDKTRQCGMEEAPNEASWSQSRQAEEEERLIEGETHGGGCRERKRGEKGVRHAGCMAAQAALLYQEATVGVFLLNSAEKPKAMPNSTSVNQAAITSLIVVFFYLFWVLLSPHRETEHHYGGEKDAQLSGCAPMKYRDPSQPLCPQEAAD